MKHLRTVLSVLVLAGTPLISVAQTAPSKDWWPTPVDVWDPPFGSAPAAKSELYSPLQKAAQKVKICVSFPHLKDPYWLAVNYGIIAEARRQGVSVQLVEAGGYTNLDKQLAQVEDCVAGGAKAVILSAISADGVKGLVDNLRAKNIPVIDLVNGIKTTVDAKSLQSYVALGHMACKHVVDQAKGAKKTLALFPGPAGAGWSTDSETGCKKAVEGSSVKIVATKWGDTGKETQLKLVEEVIQAQTTGGKTDLDYIVGNSVTAEAAVLPVRDRKLSGQIGIIGTYYTIGNHIDLKRGAIIGGPTDQPVTQGRIAVDQAVRILEKKPYMRHVGPALSMISKETLSKFDEGATLAPTGWKPVFRVD
jgi:protein TorT